MPCEKLLEYLDENGASYELFEHAEAYTAQEIADEAHISGKQFAKTVMVKLDGRMAMAVLPAANKVNFTLLMQAAGAEAISLAAEPEFKELFPDCDLGAMPPFGNLYGMEVWVAGSLGETPEIVFNAGTHTELIRMRYADFERLVKPKTARFSFRRYRELQERS
jgi:Ala-tRNA(Pro) deacylase